MGFCFVSLAIQYSIDKSLPLGSVRVHAIFKLFTTSRFVRFLRLDERYYLNHIKHQQQNCVLNSSRKLLLSSAVSGRWKYCQWRYQSIRKIARLILTNNQNQNKMFLKYYSLIRALYDFTKCLHLVYHNNNWYTTYYKLVTTSRNKTVCYLLSIMKVCSWGSPSKWDSCKHDSRSVPEGWPPVSSEWRERFVFRRGNTRPRAGLCFPLHHGQEVPVPAIVWRKP